MRFLYAVTLDRPEDAARIPLPRKADPLPAIFSRDEVARLLDAIPDLWMRTAAKKFMRAKAELKRLEVTELRTEPVI